MAELIPIEDEKAKLVLSYPRFDGKLYLRNIRALKEIGIDVLLSEGRVDIGKFKVVGKGCVGIVLLGILNGEKVAIKVLRSDANRTSLEGEGAILKLVNEAGIGPKLISVKDTVIVMEYIEGEFLPNWLRNEKNSEKIIKIIREILEQCYKLDVMGIDHGELSNPKEHIIVKNERVVIIDFETASLHRKCRNLSSIISYLFFNKENAEILKKIIKWDGEILLKLIKEYKSSFTAYLKILNEIEKF
ncbi:MAG: protein kinase [Candidatus Methanomethyliaceae archaeon]|nr:protein kinase [Candidatus Methanomethyliaceae archaeon]MDW7971200.1 RIO1 family regulatory kinase/ATPase [Nitrososphaerota archaeon]